MENEKPITFYRYFDIDGALATFKTKTLRWSHPSTFNDPFDCNINVCRTPDPASISDEWNKECNKRLSCPLPFKGIGKYTTVGSLH